MKDATKRIHTFELKVTNPEQPERGAVVWCTGSVKLCAEHAVTEMYRKDRSTPDDELEALEATLRKNKTAVFRGRTFTIEAIVEEYEKQEDDE